MKIRVSWTVGRLSWQVDFAADDSGDAASLAKVHRLLTIGFHTESKSGVETYYPAHRVSVIKRRRLK